VLLGRNSARPRCTVRGADAARVRGPLPRGARPGLASAGAARACACGASCGGAARRADGGTAPVHRRRASGERGGRDGTMAVRAMARSARPAVRRRAARARRSGAALSATATAAAQKAGRAVGRARGVLSGRVLPRGPGAARGG
jgi:hypothetical protein